MFSLCITSSFIFGHLCNLCSCLFCFDNYFYISFFNSGPQITVIKYFLHPICLWGSPTCLWAMPTKSLLTLKMRKLEISRYVWYSSCFQLIQSYREGCPTYQTHSVRRGRKIKRETQLSQVNFIQIK